MRAHIPGYPLAVINSAVGSVFFDINLKSSLPNYIFFLYKRPMKEKKGGMVVSWLDNCLILYNKDRSSDIQDMYRAQRQQGSRGINSSSTKILSIELDKAHLETDGSVLGEITVGDDHVYR